MREKLSPSAPFAAEVQGYVIDRIDTAATRLDLLIEHKAQDAYETAKSVHEVRKQIKAARGAVALLGGEAGKRGAKADAALRNAGRALSSMRDAQAMLETVAAMRADAKGKDRWALKSVKRGLVKQADKGNATIADTDERLVEAADRLSKARRHVDRWKLDPEVSLGPGLQRTYRHGRRRLSKARSSPSDARMHRLRKAVKALYNQSVLLDSDAPSIMTPIVDQLDLLGNLLGTHNDLAVLRERINDSPSSFGGKKTVKRVTRLARARQEALREETFSVAETIYSDKPTAFTKRIKEYWSEAHQAEHNSELQPFALPHSGGSNSPRQRRFLVDGPPKLPPRGTEVVIGHLALDGTVAVWIEDAGPGQRVLRVVASADPFGRDLEARLGEDAFEVVWPSTAGRRVRTMRYAVEASGHEVELAAFADHLKGLVVVTAHFDSAADAELFEPPDWFGREVSGDRRYLNVLLATDGLSEENFA